MCLAQGPQRSDTAVTLGPLVSSQALYHWAIALPYPVLGLLGIIGLAPHKVCHYLLSLNPYSTSISARVKVQNFRNPELLKLQS